MATEGGPADAPRAIIVDTGKSWRRPNLDAQQVLNAYLNDKWTSFKRILICHGKTHGNYYNYLTIEQLDNSLLVDSNDGCNPDIVASFSEGFGQGVTNVKIDTTKTIKEVDRFLSKCVVPPNSFDQVVVCACPKGIPASKSFWNDVRYLLKVGGMLKVFPLERYCLNFDEGLLDSSIYPVEDEIRCENFEEAIKRLGFKIHTMEIIDVNNVDYKSRTGKINIRVYRPQEDFREQFTKLSRYSGNTYTFYALNLKYVGVA